MGYGVPKHGVRSTIFPISTPFFIMASRVRGASIGYVRVRQETYLTSTQVPGTGTRTLPLGTGTLAT